MYIQFTETLFLQCPRLSILCREKEYPHTLLSILSGSANLALWLTCRNQAQSVGSIEPVLLPWGLLKASFGWKMLII